MLTETGETWPALAVRGLAKAFGTKIAVAEINLDVPRGRSSASSDPTAPARPPPCAWSPGCCAPTTARCGSTASTCGPTRSRPRRGSACCPRTSRCSSGCPGASCSTFHGLLRNMDDRRRCEPRRRAPRSSRPAPTPPTRWSSTTATACARRSCSRRRSSTTRRCSSSTSRSRPIDPVSARAIRSRARTASRARGGTIVFSSHVMELVERMCDHVAVMVDRADRVGRPDRAPARRRLARRRLRRARGRTGRTTGIVVVGTFVRLKLRLLRNGLSIGQGAVLFGIGAFGAAMLGFVGFVTLAAARQRCERARSRDRRVRRGDARMGRASDPRFRQRRDARSATARDPAVEPPPARERRARGVTRGRRSARDAARVQRCARRASRTTSPRWS